MPDVCSTKRFDCFISFHGSQEMESLGFPFHDEYSTVRHFVSRLAITLKDIERRHPSIFMDSQVLDGEIDDLFDAVLQLRGGGVALILLTCDYLESDYCLAELRAFMELEKLRNNERRKDEAVIVRVVCLEPDTEEKTGVNRVLEKLTVMNGNGDGKTMLSPFVEHLKHFVLHSVSHDTTVENVVDQVCKHVKKHWTSSALPCLGEDRPKSFKDILRFFSKDDAFGLASTLNVDHDDRRDVVYVIDKARQQNIITYEDVSKLLEAAHSCRRNEDAQKAVCAYQRKWRSNWSWSEPLRSKLMGFRLEAKGALANHS